MPCRLCKHDSVSVLIDFGQHPIVHNLLQSPNESVDQYPFRLGCCEHCGFLQLIDPIDPDILYKNYFTISSWKSQPHVSRLIQVIESLSGINPEDSSIFEIGCNDGSFLLSLQEKGYRKISGIEPTKDASQIAISRGLEIYHSFFGEETASTFYADKKFDLIVIRHVLEHIVNLDDFFSGINLLLKDDGMLVIEIPDGEMNLTYFDYALWEEHVNYFTLQTLSNLLAKHSLSVVHYETTLFSGKALTVFCQKKHGHNNITAESQFKFDHDQVFNYAKKWNTYREQLQSFLANCQQPIVIYGCGNRSSNFVNFTGIADLINCFVDDQTEKQGLFVPGCKLKIHKWEELAGSDYTFLLGVNSENEQKVISKRKLTEGHYFSILPPSRYLPTFWENIIYN